jgi:acetyl-CoA carboxylase carboxyl transferase subunit alpha
MFADDRSIVAGIGKIDRWNVALIGHQKGRDTREKLQRNFGMPKPEGYRKAQRVMKLAEKFGLPIVTLIDTPGAYPGIDAEERGQSEAIARSLSVMTGLRVPVISVVIGVGGSGGALAIGVCDRLIMMQYSTYSVISPEGCASILWKSPDKAPEAAAAMKITSADLKQLGLVDEIVQEPLGGAHRNCEQAAAHLNTSLIRHLDEVSNWTIPELLNKRYERLRSFGEFQIGK